MQYPIVQHCNRTQDLPRFQRNAPPIRKIYRPNPSMTPYLSLLSLSKALIIHPVSAFAAVSFGTGSPKPHPPSRSLTKTS